ncbi:fumarylacetoacetate hydrolase family protein [Azospirillum sp. ST 5-10]|uniref:fumarylacetoacetate hydrolase family protein n=1 Tax=unclassified Azospirillum TaxID=2630922 RepID=UPI003F49B83A
MRICRFDDQRLGVVVGDEVADVTDVAEAIPAVRWPLPPGDLFVAALPDLRGALERRAATAPRRPLGSVRLLSPVANPGKIVAAPVNYTLHLEESRRDAGINFGSHVKTIDEYGVFLKAPSSLVGPGEGVVSPRRDRRTDHEIELAAVIGRGGRDIPEAEALAHVAGYTIGLDMTIRGTEDRSYRKSLDTFSVLGPWLVTADAFGDPGDVDFELRVNGAVRQASNTRHLIYGVARLIAYASHAYRLDPGDVILTGTPEGVGPVEPGDVMDCRIERIGRMAVAVRDA